MTAAGTVFDAKTETVSTGQAGQRYRYGYRQGWVHLLLAFLGG